MLSKRIFVLVSLLLVSFLLVGCGLTTPPVVGNEAPFITTTSVTDAEVGILYTYDVDATDPNFDTLTYSLIRNPSGMEIDEHTGLITWTPNSAGSFGVTVKVSDGVLYVTQPFTITVTGVVELTGITVDLDTMALEVGGEARTFTVTASYSFGSTKDVTTDCVYTQPTTGVVTVTAGIVTAVKAGTDTILISYQENGVTATANISVTVSKKKIPMTITVDLPPTFTVGGPYWFTFNMIANDDSGKEVKASFDWPTSEGVKIAGSLETDVLSDVTFTLEGDTFRTVPFTMEDTTTVNFRGTFISPGTFFTTIEVETIDSIPLCSKEITIVVEGDPLAVGDNYGGGIVAYIDGTGQHGLIAALTDQSDGIVWATEAYQITEVGTLSAIGSGSANTDAIIAQHIDVAISTYAAGLARDYRGGDYVDWFLPSKDELNLMYENLKLSDIGGFAGCYWSSYEFNSFNAWSQNFDDGGPSDYSKSDTYRVRAVRAF